MENYQKLYINGEWVNPSTPHRRAIINPTSEEAFAEVGQANADDVDKAVKFARKAF